MSIFSAIRGTLDIRPLLVVFLMIFLGVGAAMIVVAQRGSEARDAAAAAERQAVRAAHDAREAEERAREAAATGPARSRVEAPGGDRNPTSGAPPSSFLVRVVDRAGRRIPNAMVSATGSRAASIVAEGDDWRVDAVLPVVVSAMSDETAGARSTKVTQVPKDGVSIILANKVNIQLNVRGGDPETLAETRGVVIFYSDGFADVRLGIAPNSTLSAPEGLGRMAYMSEFFESEIVDVQLQEGVVVNLDAKPRKTGSLIVKNTRGQVPYIQFSMNPGESDLLLDSLKTMGSVAPRREGDLYIFDAVPVGTARVLIDGDPNPVEREITIAAGVRSELSF